MLNSDPVNEKVFSFELGYGFNTPEFALTANAYYTKWMDKTTTRGGTVSRGEHEGDRYFMNMSGVDARHMGIEFNASWVPAQWVNIQAMLSYGDWIWDSNASGYFWNQLGQPLKNTNGDVASGIMAPDHLHATIDQKGVKVGGSAQTTGSISADFIPFKGFRIGADWVFNATTLTIRSAAATSRTAALSPSQILGKFPGDSSLTSTQAIASRSEVSTPPSTATSTTSSTTTTLSMPIINRPKRANGTMYSVYSTLSVALTRSV